MLALVQGGSAARAWGREGDRREALEARQRLLPCLINSKSVQRYLSLS